MRKKLHLVYWLTLILFETEEGKNHSAPLNAGRAHGAVLGMCGPVHNILPHAWIRCHGRDSALAIAVGNDFKGSASVALYLVAIAVAQFNRWVSLALYVAVAVMWLVSIDGSNASSQRAVSPPRISILLPVWNAVDTISLALESIRRQTEPAWECVVVDDGFDDGTAGVPPVAAAADPRVRVVGIPHRGLVAALNEGLHCTAPSSRAWTRTT